MEDIVASMRQALGPGCVTACVADADPKTPAFEPACQVVRERVDSSGVATRLGDVPPCGPGPSVPTNADVCYVALLDPIQTPTDSHDVMSTACSDQGWNLELRLLWRPGVTRPEGSRTQATCQPSLRPEFDCPRLP